MTTRDELQEETDAPRHFVKFYGRITKSRDLFAEDDPRHSAFDSLAEQYADHLRGYDGGGEE